MWRWLMILGLTLWPMGMGAWTPERWFDRPRSPRVASYKVEAALDWQEKVLDGLETLTWRNTGEAPTAELRTFLTLARNIENVTGKT